MHKSGSSKHRSVSPGGRASPEGKNTAPAGAHSRTSAEFHKINRQISTQLNEKYRSTTDLNFHQFNLDDILGFSDEEKMRQSIQGEEGLGVEIFEKDCDELFKLINPYQFSKITRKQLTKFLEGFGEEYTKRDIQLLMNNKYELDSRELYELLKDNKLDNYDPIKETYKLLEGENGYIDIDYLAEIFHHLGKPEMSQFDKSILKDVTDLDGDGIVSINDLYQITKDIDEKRLMGAVRKNFEDESEEELEGIGEGSEGEGEEEREGDMTSGGL